MSLIRLEAREDGKSGLFYLEIYHPADAMQPLVTTEARYKTAAAVENDILAIIASRANSFR